MSGRASSVSADSIANLSDFMAFARGTSTAPDSPFKFDSVDSLPIGEVFPYPVVSIGDGKRISRFDTTVYDLRTCCVAFVKGVNLDHNWNDIEVLSKHIQAKYHTEDRNIVLDSRETFSVCCILNEEQLSEVQILISSPLAFEEEFTEVSGEVIRCISVTPNTDVRELLNIYNKKTEASMDCLFFQQASIVAKEGSVLKHNINSLDKGRLFQDCEVDLCVTYFIDEKREMVLFLNCRKSDNVLQIKKRLIQEFATEFADIANQNLELWLIRHNTILRDRDCIFLDENLSPAISDQEYSLAAYVGESESVAVPFQFQKVNKVVLVPPAVTPEEFRHAVAKVIHKPAKCLKILLKERKVTDTDSLARLPVNPNRNLLKVELATEKVYTLALVNEKRTIDIKAYKQETIGDVKEKVAACLAIHPFNLQLYLNASSLDENLTLHATRIRTEDNVQIVIFPYRVRICLRQCKGEKLFLIIDDTNKTTVSVLKEFCGKTWQADPDSVSIIFRGSILNEEKMTLCDAGVVSGSVLVANGFQEDKLAYRHKLMKLFVAGSDNGINQMRAIKIGGRFHAVDFDDNHQIDEPQETSSTTGLHVDCLKNNHSATSVESPTPDQKVNIITQTAMTNPKDLQNLASSTVPLTTGDISDIARSTTGNVAIVTSPSPTSLSTTLSPNTMRTISTTSPTLGKFYLGDDVTTKDVVHQYQAMHIMHSSEGAFVGMQSTRAAYVAPLDFTGPRHSMSDSALLPVGTQGHMPMTQSMPLCPLPEPRDAVPESVLNAVADKLGNDWCKVGLTLGIKFEEIQKISHDHQNDLKRQALHMVHSWKRQCGGMATVERLCDALRKCELTIIAESIENHSAEGTSDAH